MARAGRVAVLAMAVVGCGGEMQYGTEALEVSRVSDLAVLGPGWSGEIVATVDQSFSGWSVDIADADGDGQPEILTGTAPSSRLYLFRKRAGAWESRLLLDHAASDQGAIMDARVVDLDGDGQPEVIAGTGEVDDSTAQLYVLHTDGERATMQRSLRAPGNTSSYTHGLATADLDGDGRLEIVSAYCGNGEVFRYDVTGDLDGIEAQKVTQVSGSGEDAWLADVDGDGRLEMIVSNGYRDDEAQVEIHDIDPTGNPLPNPRLVLNGYDGHGAFYASVAVGDIDGDARPELIVAWKPQRDENRATIIAYHVTATGAQVAYVLSHDDQDLDSGFFEKMMKVVDTDGDGRPELLVTTRGDVSPDGTGHVYLYRVTPDGDVSRETVASFDNRLVQSSWPAFGDADGDGKPELVLTTGKGDARNPGTSWVLSLHRGEV